MARKKLKLTARRRRPTLGLALAVFVVACGVILLIASALDRGGGESGQTAAVKKLRRAASNVKDVVADTDRVLGEVEGARNALEATDYGQARQYLQSAQDGLNDLGSRLDSVHSALEQLARSPEISQLPAATSVAVAGENQR